MSPLSTEAERFVVRRDEGQKQSDGAGRGRVITLPLPEQRQQLRSGEPAPELGGAGQSASRRWRRPRLLVPFAALVGGLGMPWAGTEFERAISEGDPRAEVGVAGMRRVAVMPLEEGRNGSDGRRDRGRLFISRQVERCLEMIGGGKTSRRGRRSARAANRP